MDTRFARNCVSRVGTTDKLVRTSILVLVALTVFWVTTVAAAEQAPLPDSIKTLLNGSNRHEKAGWVYLHVQGSPRQRGFQYGYLLHNEIATGIRATQVDWEFTSAMDWSWLVERGGNLMAPKVDSENLAELDGIVEGLKATGVSASRNEIIAYNGYFELAYYWWPQEIKKIKEGTDKPNKESCSAFIATGSMTSGGGIVLGHNTMGSYWSTLPNVIIDIVPDKGHRIMMQTYPGWIHSGTDFFITNAGLVGAETTIGWFEGFDTTGTPEFSRMRRAMQDADSIGDWCRIMKQGNNGGYANAWLLGDENSGEIARLELGLRHVGFESKRDGYFTGSNIAEDRKILRLETNSQDTDIRNSTVARRVRWNQLMKQYAGKIDVSLGKQFEADHYDVYLGQELPGERTLCAHGDKVDRPMLPWPSVPNNPGGTIDAKVVDSKMAKQMKFAARWGSACGTAFDAQKFLEQHPQFDWMKEILQSRPSEPWTEFVAGEER
jgi:hypothetical protein